MENAAFGSGITVREAFERIESALSDYCIQADALHENQVFAVQIPGSSTFEELRYRRCELKQDLDATTPMLSLTVAMTADDVLGIEYCGEASEFLNFLKAAGLSVKSSRVLRAAAEGQVAEIEVEPKVDLELLFMQAGARHIKMLLRNHEVLGELHYLIRPHQVGTDFLEQLHRFLAHSPNHFLEQLTQKMTAGEDPEEATVQANIEDLAELSRTAEILSFQQHVEASKANADVVELCFRELSMKFDRNHPVCHMGRKFPADILIRSKFVSRDHATLVYENGEFILHDHSSNGSYVQVANRSVSFLHNEAIVLKKSGRISLGVSFEDDAEDDIEYTIG